MDSSKNYAVFVDQLANKIIAEWSAFLEVMRKETADVLIESAYEICTKDNIQTYITEEKLELNEQQLKALLSLNDVLTMLYDEWNRREYLNSYSDVAELLQLTADRLIEYDNECAVC